jgi:hypothetical protein
MTLRWSAQFLRLGAASIDNPASSPVSLALPAASWNGQRKCARSGALFPPRIEPASQQIRCRSVSLLVVWFAIMLQGDKDPDRQKSNEARCGHQDNGMGIGKGRATGLGKGGAC